MLLVKIIVIKNKIGANFFNSLETIRVIIVNKVHNIFSKFAP